MNALTAPLKVPAVCLLARTAAAAMLLLAFAAAAHAQPRDALIATIPAPPGSPTDAHFGASVAVNNIYTVVGVPNDDTRVRGAGVVKVFETGGGRLLLTIPHPEANVNDAFGSAVAISGTRVVVGAPRWGNASRTIGGPVGMTYVFDLASPTPTVPIAKLEAPTRSSDAQGGAAVAIDGTRVVVGVPFDDRNGTNAGVAFVFDLASATHGRLVSMLVPPSPRAEDRFGSAVAIRGGLVLVGAPQVSENEGLAFLFDAAGGSQPRVLATLRNPGTGGGDGFGAAIAFDGARALIGAPGDRTCGVAAGSAFLFDVCRAPSAPTMIFRNPAPAAGDDFGRAVALEEWRVLIGAPLDDDRAPDSGTAYIFDAQSPVARGTSRNPNAGAGDQFGASVAMAGMFGVVGVPFSDRVLADAGDAYFYKITNISGTSPLGFLNDAVRPEGDGFGSALALTIGAISTDDPRLVVGAPFEDTGAPDAGAVYMFNSLTGRSMIPLKNIAPNAGAGFGAALAARGPAFIAGVPGDNSAAPGAGLMYSYFVPLPREPQPSAGRNPDPRPGDAFGNAVLVADLGWVVAAFHAKPGGRVYVRRSINPLALTNPSGAWDDEFGAAIAASGHRLIVGAPLEDTGASGAGSVYVYDVDGLTPTIPVLALHNPQPAYHANFGAAVAIAGSKVAVSAPLDDSATCDAGIVYLYDLLSPNPAVPIAVLRNPAPRWGDRFGAALAITESHLVVGAPYADAPAPDSGAVLVYDLTNAAPAGTGRLLVSPVGAAGDRFGAALSLARSTLAVGAPGSDTSGRDQGAVYVFELGLGSDRAVAPLALRTGTHFGLVGQADGYVQATLGRAGAVTMRLQYRGETLALAGVLDAKGTLERTVARRGRSPLRVRFTVAATGTATLEVGDGASVVAATLQRAAGTASDPARQAGRYTALISPEAAAAKSGAVPSGYGAITVVVASNGRVTLLGKLPDGTAVSHANWVSESGEWPLFLPLYGNAGLLEGDGQFGVDQGAGEVRAALLWRRPAMRTTLYRDGFEIAAILTGTRYEGLQPRWP